MADAPAPLILVSNDDGVFSNGIAALAEALAPLGEVWVFAPDREQSAVGHGITLEYPLRVYPRGERRFAVTGTPADCVYFAVNAGLPRRPDVLVSGINRGYNLGNDVLYSGTVAAAIEGCLHELPSLAVSLGPKGDLAVAQDLAARVTAELLERGLPIGTLLNLNIPSRLAPDWSLTVCHLGEHRYERRVITNNDPRGRPYYWIGGEELDMGAVPGTDSARVGDGHPTLTPLKLDMTHHALLESLTSWRVVDEARAPRE